MVDTRIIVDFDHVSLIIDHLQIHSIQAFPDEIGSLYRRIQYHTRHLIDRNRIHQSAAAPARIIMAVNLPMTFCHIILAGIQRYSVQQTDTPVKLRRRKCLRQQDSRLLEKEFKTCFQFFFIGHLFHANGIGTVRYLQDKRSTNLLTDLFERVLIGLKNQRRLRCRNLFFLKKFFQINLIGTPDDRQRIINDDHSILGGQL